MAVRERIVIVDEDRFGRLEVERVPSLPPALQLMPPFVAVGAGREEWERAAAVEAEYLPPQSRAA